MQEGVSEMLAMRALHVITSSMSPSAGHMEHETRGMVPGKPDTGASIHDSMQSYFTDGYSYFWTLGTCNTSILQLGFTSSLPHDRYTLYMTFSAQSATLDN